MLTKYSYLFNSGTDKPNRLVKKTQKDKVFKRQREVHEEEKKGTWRQTEYKILRQSVRETMFCEYNITSSLAGQMFVFEV